MMAVQEPQHLLLAVRRAPRIVWDCIILLIVGHGVTFMAAIVYRIAPRWSMVEVNWFWCPDFNMKLSHEWWLKYLGDYLLNIITYYIMAKVAAKFSDALFIVSVIFFGYHLIDILMFMWDYGGQFYVFLDVLYTAIILIKYAVLPYRPEKFAKLRSLF